MNAVLVVMFVNMHVLTLLVVFTAPVKWDIIFLTINIVVKVKYDAYRSIIQIAS